MSRNVKIVVAVVGGLLLLGCLAVLVTGALGARFLGQAVNPDNAREVAAKIAAYELPPGYHEVMGLDVMGTQMVMIAPEGLTSGDDAGAAAAMVIMMMQTPEMGNADQMREQLLAQLSRSTGAGDFQVVDTRDATVRGKPVTLEVAEGTDRDGRQTRMVSGVFQGLGGPAMIMGLAPAERWDGTAFQELIESMD